MLSQWNVVDILDTDRNAFGVSSIAFHCTSLSDIKTTVSYFTIVANYMSIAYV
jgi:hypothetical protein